MVAAGVMPWPPGDRAKAPVPGPLLSGHVKGGKETSRLQPHPAFPSIPLRCGCRWVPSLCALALNLGLWSLGPAGAAPWAHPHRSRRLCVWQRRAQGPSR